MHRPCRDTGRFQRSLRCQALDTIAKAETALVAASTPTRTKERYSMRGDGHGQTGRTGQRKRGSVKHVQQTRVGDGEGREKSTARGKEQKIAEKKEARPNVKNRRMQKKTALKRKERESADDI
jgi:hypothetical protein